MSVTSVIESWSRRNAGYQSPDGRTLSFSATTAYQVEHDASDSEDTILLASGIPRVRDTFTGKPGVYCTDVKRDPIGPNFSIVTAQWLGQRGSTETEAPENQLPTWQWTNTTTTEPVDVDADGLVLCNANGELKEGFTKEISDFTLTVNRNFAAINTYTLANYLDSTSSDPYGSPDSIWPAGSATLRRFTADIQREGVAAYYAVTAQIDFRIPYNTVFARAWWYRYRNDGFNERVGTTITFTGGGGSGAAAYAVTSGGAITDIVVTARGRDYTSAPTVVITSSTGGSGASGTATVSNGRVTAVSVGAGGTGYRSKLIRAVDANGDPESRPVCLKSNGAREYSASNAIWIERKKKTYSLPYSGLGLF